MNKPRPDFIGANPPPQAGARGIRITGAPARAPHSGTVNDLTRIGRILEQQVLVQTVRLHLERRVFVCRNKTVVFT